MIINLFTATSIRIANKDPVHVAPSQYTEIDKTLARLLGGWRALTIEQYRYLNEQTGIFPGRTRIPELIKRGFIVRHELLDENNKRICGYYVTGPVAAKLCGLSAPPELDLTLTVSVLMCNQLIISGLVARWDVRRIFDLGIGRVPCWITRLGQSYGVLPLFGHPHAVVTTLSRARRGLLIVPDADAAISFAKVAPIPVRYLLWSDLLNWQILIYKVEDGELIPATISFSNNVQSPVYMAHGRQ